MKGKAMSGLMQVLSTPDQYLHELKDKERKVLALVNLKQGSNPGVVVVVGVAGLVPSTERVP